MNDKFIQIKGPFRKDVDLIPYIRDLYQKNWNTNKSKKLCKDE